MLNIGIIGCGRNAKTRHAAEYAANQNCRIAAFCSMRSGGAEPLAAQYGAIAFDSVDRLLLSDIDAVSICTANALHAEIAVKALRAGKHVLCEKPMATTLGECEAMVRAAEESGKVLMIAMNQRFSKAHVAARRIIGSGELGKVLSFSATFAHAGPDNRNRGKDTWFFDRAQAGFGAMADLGVHKTDLIHYLTGERIVKTQATFATLEKTKADGTPIDVEDTAIAIYTLESGAVGSMHASWTNCGATDNTTRVYLEHGVLHLYADPAYALIVEHKNGECERYALDATNVENSGVIDAFVDGILTGKAPEPSGRTALESMKVIFANAVSAAEGRAVTIEY